MIVREKVGDQVSFTKVNGFDSYITFNIVAKVLILHCIIYVLKK